MRDFINHVMTTFKTSGLPLKELAHTTGIQETRCHRLRHGLEPKATEIIKIAEGFNLTVEDFLQVQIQQEKEKARLEAFKEVYEQAEIKIAQKYGITPELMDWRLSDPKFNKAI